MNYRILLFTTPFCVNCRTTKPFVHKKCEEHGVDVVETDPTAGSESIVQLWDLKKVPTIIAVKVREDGSNGDELCRDSGAMTPSSIEEFLLHTERLLKGHE